MLQTDKAVPAKPPLTSGAEALGAPEPLRRAGGSLSLRLLILTICFMMLVEAAIFGPNLASFRRNYLSDKMSSAHLILTALEAADDQIDPRLRDRLLDQSGLRGMTASRPHMGDRTLGPQMPSQIPKLYDLRNAMFGDQIGDTLATLMRRGSLMIGVTGISPLDPNVVIEVVLDEQPMRDAMWRYSARMLLFSILLSLTTSMLVYASIQWLAVHPLRRITANMVSFQDAPEDPARIIVPIPRTDEVGVAEQTLAKMQRELRAALLQKNRLAGVGAAVTKISHDLRNVLATAMLESDRLEAQADPEVKRITAGLVRAVDRAAVLATSTLRFAKEDLPEVKLRSMHISAALEDLRTHLAPVTDTCLVSVSAAVDFKFSGDLALLQRVFENLVRNAAEASATSVTLTSAIEGEQFLVRVVDNGSGLAPKAVQNLFRPFAGSARAGGTGLGLPIARELMRAQGGDLSLESTSADGTTFVIRLPS